MQKRHGFRPGQSTGRPVVAPIGGITGCCERDKHFLPQPLPVEVAVVALFGFQAGTLLRVHGSVEVVAVNHHGAAQLREGRRQGRLARTTHAIDRDQDHSSVASGVDGSGNRFSTDRDHRHSSILITAGASVEGYGLAFRSRCRAPCAAAAPAAQSTTDRSKDAAVDSGEQMLPGFGF